MVNQQATDKIFSFKVVFLDDSTVGKTTIVSEAHTGYFTPDSVPTVGASFLVKNLNMGDYFIKLNMWDTAGQERFRSLTPMFYRETDFIVLIYSVDNLQSFKSLASWCNSITTECVTQPTIVVVANKSDLESQRMVTTETGLNFAVEHGFDFIELSAKDQPDKINDLMNLIGKKCLTKIISKDVNEPTDVLVHAEKSSCC